MRHSGLHSSSRSSRHFWRAALAAGFIVAVSAGVAAATGREEAPPPGPGGEMIVAPAPSREERPRIEGGVSADEYRLAVAETVSCLRDGDITVTGPVRDDIGRWQIPMSYPREQAAEADRVYQACYERYLDDVEAAWLDARPAVEPSDPQGHTEDEVRASAERQHMARIDGDGPEPEAP